MTDPLSDTTLEHVRQGWALLVPRLPELATRFFERLFEALPQLRQRYSDNLAGERAQLIAMLCALVASADSPSDAGRYVARIARDRGYSQQEHDALAAALLQAMADVGCARWSETHTRAWRTLLERIVDVMAHTTSRGGTDA